MTRITSTLREDLCKFVTLALWILLGMRNVLDENCRENQNTFCVQEIYSDSLDYYEIMCKNAKCIAVFPVQQWLCERATM
jgi:hypothetical protein